MSLVVGEPRALLLLLALPLLLRPWPATRLGRAAVVARGVAMALLVALLAGVHAERDRPASGACVVVTVDLSGSVGEAARAAAARALDVLERARGDDDLLGVVAFGARPTVVAFPASGRRDLHALLDGVTSGAVGADGTDVDAALTTASALCPAERQAAIVLVTDGRETRGRALATLAADTGPPAVFALSPDETALPGAAVRRVLAPAVAHERGVVPVEAVVESRLPAPVEATVTLAANGAAVLQRPARVPPGLSVIALPVRPGTSGARLLDVGVELPSDVPPPPGGARALLHVDPPPRVLVVGDRPESVAATALAEHGLGVERVAPAAFGDLHGVHVVVLDDVPRAALSDAAVDALARWVAAGGGLVVTGGRRLFGDPGWRASPLAPLLPVRLEPQAPEPKEREPIALYVVIDRSNSMGWASRPEPGSEGEKMEYARRAALAVIDQLGPGDFLGAIAFDSQPYELGPLRPVAASRGALTERIRALVPGGGTDFKDALDRARRALDDAPTQVRHIILLTDGDTNRRAEDHDALIDALAADGISVTAIRIGADTVNLELLQRLATATGGTFHHVEDARALPQLMIRDTRRLMDAPGQMANAPVRLGMAGTTLAGIDVAEMPRVARWAVTRVKPDAEERLWLDADGRRDPLLATWQYELGRVAALPVDFQSGAAALAGWPGFGKLWTQVALWAMPDAVPGERHLVARATPAGPRLRLETAADETGPFTLELADGTTVDLPRTGRRTFEALVPRLGPGVQRVAVAGTDAADRRWLDVVVPESADDEAERRAVGTDHAWLARLAAATGGAVDVDPATVLAARPGRAREAVPLEPVLLPLVLLLVVADVAARRLG